SSAEAVAGPAGARERVGRRHGAGARLEGARRADLPRGEFQRERVQSDITTNQLDAEMVTKAYARWAPVYDLVFGAVFEKGRALAIEAAERIGGRIPPGGGGHGTNLP